MYKGQPTISVLEDDDSAPPPSVAEAETPPPSEPGDVINPEEELEKERVQLKAEWEASKAKLPAEPERDVMLFLLEHAPLQRLRLRGTAELAQCPREAAQGGQRGRMLFPQSRLAHVHSASEEGPRRAKIPAMERMCPIGHREVARGLLVHSRVRAAPAHRRQGMGLQP